MYIYKLVNYFIRNYFYWKFSLIYTFAYLCKLRVQFVYPHFCLNNIILSDRLDILQTMLFFHKYQSLDGSDIGAKSIKVKMRVRESEVWLAKMAFTWNIYLSCLLNDKKLYQINLFCFSFSKNSAHDKLFQPFLCITDFVKPQKQEVITLFDVASGNLDHLNLKQVVSEEVIHGML